MTQSAESARRHEIIDLASLPGVACPCGTARRALMDVLDLPLSIHLTDISTDARTHYHRHLTEAYYILSCAPEAQIELDGQPTALAPGRLVLIRPGVRHRAIGQMQVLVVVHPKFDPEDEWFD